MNPVVPIRASAPGKAILMGEHAAVYGRPALVAAVNRRSTASIHPADGPDNALILDLPGLGVRRRTTWTDALRHAEEARRAWERFDRDESASFDELRPVDKSRFVEVAVGEALRAVRSADGGIDADGRPAIRLHVDSALPVGSGFGSSASVAVAVVGVVHAHFGREIDDETLHAVSLEVERRQHGRPSGIDNGTVIHGGVVWAERSDDGLRLQPLDLDVNASPLLRRLRVFHTGEPAESTGEVVAAVRRLRVRDPKAFDARLAAMEQATREVRRVLEAGGHRDALEPIRRFQAALEALAVVPAEVRKVVRQVEEAGGAAKISGAGSLSGPGAGSLLVYHPESETLDRIADSVPAMASLECLDLSLGGEGVQIERGTGF